MKKFILLAALALSACTATPTISTSQGQDSGGSSLAPLTSIRPHERPAHTPAEASSRDEYTPAQDIIAPAQPVHRSDDGDDDDHAKSDEAEDYDRYEEPEHDDDDHEDRDDDDHEDRDDDDHDDEREDD